MRESVGKCVTLSNNEMSLAGCNKRIFVARSFNPRRWATRLTRQIRDKSCFPVASEHRQSTVPLNPAVFET